MGRRQTPRNAQGGLDAIRELKLARAGRYLRISLLVIGILPAGGLAATGELATTPEPAGYRLDDFRAPVPATLAGATVVTTQELRQMLDGGDDVVLIDVLPAPRRPAKLRPGALWLPKKRLNIPGSVWLPNTGYGILPVEEEDYLRRNLLRLTGGDNGRPVLFYCLADCWMSWNAAKRAVSWDYTNVYWYPDGTDGWADAGFPLEESVPVPAPDG